MGTTAPTSWREAIIANSDKSDLNVNDESLKPFYGATKTDPSCRLDASKPLDLFIIKDALHEGKFSLIHGVLPMNEHSEEGKFALFHSGFGSSAQVHLTTIESLFGMCDGIYTPNVNDMLTVNKKKGVNKAKDVLRLQKDYHQSKICLSNAMRVPPFALSTVLDCESMDAADVLVRIKRQAIYIDELTSLFPTGDEEEDNDDEFGWILPSTPKNDNIDEEYEEYDDDEDPPGSFLALCAPLFQYLAAIALNLEIGDPPINIPTEGYGNAKSLSARHHLKYLTRFVGVPKDRACLPNFLRYNPKPSRADYIRPRDFCPIGPSPGGGAMDKEKDYHYREEYNKFYRDFNQFYAEYAERDQWLDRRLLNKNECHRWNSIQDGNSNLCVDHHTGGWERHDEMIVRCNPRGEYSPQTRYPEYCWRNHKLRRIGNRFPRNSKHNYVDSCKVEQKRQQFATDREMASRLLEDTLLEKRAQLDICAEEDYLETCGAYMDHYPPDPFSMEKYMNECIQDRIEYDISRCNRRGPDGMKKSSKYRIDCNHYY